MSVSSGSSSVQLDCDPVHKASANLESGTETLLQHTGNSREKALADRALKRVLKSRENREAAEKFKDKGNQLFKRQDYAGAADEYLNAINKSGPKPVYLSNLAAAYLKLEYYEEAEKAAHQALTQDPKFLKARYRRAVARKEQNLLKAALTDLETVVNEDPACAEAQSELSKVRVLWESGEGIEDGYSTSDYDLPHFDDDKLEIASISDSSDCNHPGNGITCRFYNHDGCARGNKCAFSHAPDDKSVRDDLGKNVCLYYLLGTCKFGDVKCIYSHTKEYLPSHGWWNNEEQVLKVKAVIEFAEHNAREQRALDNLLWKLQSNAGSKKGQHRGPNGTGRAGNGTTRGRQQPKAAAARPKPKADKAPMKARIVYTNGGKAGRPRSDSKYDEEMEQRMANGFTDYDLNELLCQGVKPWDDDAWSVLDALNY